MYKPGLFSLAAAPLALGYVLPDGTGRLPALGWNSWNAYHCDVDADKILQAADAIVSKGFKKAGYQYVNIDDCWSVKAGRDNTTHQIIPDPTKFPNGIIGVTEKIHSMGLKAGIYSSAGFTTCGGYPASLGHEQTDAETFASWGIDYLKYDNCGYPDYWGDVCYACDADPSVTSNLVNGTCTNSSVQNPGPPCGSEWPVDGRNYTQSKTSLRYQIMQHALEGVNRTILYSLCEWGVDEPWTWANQTAQSWRMSNDIQPYWADVTRIINLNSFISNFDNFGGHNDPDMLEVGNGNLTTEECRTHFALWAIMKAPLIIGTDLTNLSQTNIEILQNKYLLAFNQDPVYGAPAQPYKWGVNPDWTFDTNSPAEYWAGPSSQGHIVAMMNSLNQTRTMTADFSEIPGLGGKSYKVVNAWTGKSLGCKKGGVSMSLQEHDTAVLLVQGSC